MYYNINLNSIVNNYPNQIQLSNGSVISGESFDNNVLKDAGYYLIKSDTPPQPENTIENVFLRQVTIENDGVIIVRTWDPVIQNVPESISARQIRLWLIDNNISLTSVENAISGITDEKLREKTLVEWEFAPYVERNHPLVNTLGQILGLNSEQIDNAFIQAARL